MLAPDAVGETRASPHSSKKRALHPAATATIVAPKLRDRLCRRAPAMLGRCRAHLENAEIDVTGPDPEALFVQVQMLRDECDHILALWPGQA